MALGKWRIHQPMSFTPSPVAAIAITLVLIYWNGLTFQVGGWVLGVGLTTLFDKKSFVQESINSMSRNRGAQNNKTGNWEMALHLGTWNVRTLFKTRSMNCLVRELYN